ncbi:RNase H domain-containing protein [Trichonephila clavipes]|nr:RNase H domain-containing protein [Trichonephila clavipes]
MQQNFRMPIVKEKMPGDYVFQQDGAPCHYHSNDASYLDEEDSTIDIYLTRTNISNSDGIIELSDCRSALATFKEGKMGITQEINSLLFSIGALDISCTLQWIPAHVDIEKNEMVNSLANEARILEPVTSSTTVFDANTIANQKL